MPARPSLPKSGPLPWRRRPLCAPGCLAARRTRPRACPTSPSSPTPPASLAVPPRWIPASEAGRTGAGTRAERALWRRGGGRSAAAPVARQQPARPTTTARAKQQKRKKSQKCVPEFDLGGHTQSLTPATDGGTLAQNDGEVGTQCVWQWECFFFLAACRPRARIRTAAVAGTPCGGGGGGVRVPQGVWWVRRGGGGDGEGTRAAGV